MKEWTAEQEEHLMYLTEKAWDWFSPGYRWVHGLFESEFKTGRTVNAIKQKYYRLTQQTKDE